MYSDALVCNEYIIQKVCSKNFLALNIISHKYHINMQESIVLLITEEIYQVTEFFFPVI